MSGPPWKISDARMIEEDKQRMMAEHKGSLFGMFGGVKDAPKEGEGEAPTAAQ